MSDLDFGDHDSTYGVHAIYPYPAKFPPQLPDYFVKKYKENVDDYWILDPFGGSGTTAAVALENGCNFIHVDLMPISKMLCDAKTAYYSKSNMDIFRVMAHEFKWFPTEVEPSDGLLHKLTYRDNQYYWFRETTMKRILGALEFGKELPEHLQVLWNILAMAKIRAAGNMKSGEICTTLEKEKQPQDYIDLFPRHINKQSRKIESYCGMNKGAYEYCDGLNLNSKTDDLDKKIRNEAVELIITSPPYGDLKVVNYRRYHEFAHHFLGEELPKESDFIQTSGQLLLYMAKFVPKLVKGGHFIVVVAPSVNANWVRDSKMILEKLDLEKIKIYERTIPQQMRRIYKDTGILKEFVLDYKKR